VSQPTGILGDQKFRLAAEMRRVGCDGPTK
jgi:hypothetical protein